MNGLVVAVAVLAIVLLGLAVMVGKVEAGDAMVRLGVFILLLCLVPVIAALAKASLPLLIKPILLLLAIVAVVTVLVAALRTLLR